jgi:hypothetical protein
LLGLVLPTADLAPSQGRNAPIPPGDGCTGVPLLIVDDLGMRKLPHTAAEDLLEAKSFASLDFPAAILPHKKIHFAELLLL